MTARHHFGSVSQLNAPQTLARGFEVRGACYAQPDAWDLDVLDGDYQAVMAARDACATCPALAMCRRELVQTIADGVPPQSVVWAGTAFTKRGVAIDPRDLRKQLNRRAGSTLGRRRSMLKSASGAEGDAA